LAPNPKLLPQTSAVSQNPLSTISNEEPALVSKLFPKLMGKKSHVLHPKIPLKLWYHLLHILDVPYQKKASSAISNEEYELSKYM
jgi:hypothetical protein